MQHHPIFDDFERVTSTGTGIHMFDFIGSKTRVSFRKGWETYALPPGKRTTPNLPPRNEHYFDWIATLTAVAKASGTFRMAELGAGWGPWVVRGALAAQQKTEIQRVELLAVEADPNHYDWVKEHFRDNGLDKVQNHILFGAVAGTSGVLRFPAIENPNEDYGASLRSVKGDTPYVEVPAFTLSQLMAFFSGPLDFIHVDIQGAEYDSLPKAMEDLSRYVKSIMIGTHIANEKHDALAAQFRDAGWTEIMNLERGSLTQTDYGEVQFGDGVLVFENPQLV